MAKKQGLMADVPLNAISLMAVFIFVLQAGLVMFYNSNNLTFTHIEAYRAIDAGNEALASGFKTDFRPNRENPEISGFIYPFISGAISLAVGKTNTVVVIHMLALCAMFFSMVFIYKAALAVEKRAVIPAVLLFATTAPLILGIFSGTDVIITILIVSALFYYGINLGRKDYAVYFTLNALLFVNGAHGIAFGSAFLAFGMLRLSGNGFRKNRFVYFTAAIVASVAAATLAFWGAFIKKFDIMAMEQQGVLSTTTMYVDSFFRDGFLWSKMVPFFMSVIFLFALFWGVKKEYEEYKPGIFMLAALLTAAGIVPQIFSVFRNEADTTLFASPFYVAFVLTGAFGLVMTASIAADKKDKNMQFNNVLYGLLVFVILYNLIIFAGRAVENAQKIKYIVPDPVASKYLER